MSPLEPPTAPFATSSGSPRGSQLSLGSRGNESPLLQRTDSSPVSLSVNYLPSKFSTALVTPGAGRRRKSKNVTSMLPKRGGGREAFKSGEARMPGEQDDDYDGINSGWFGGKDGGRTKPRMRWNRFKWILFISNIVVSFFLTFLLSLGTISHRQPTVDHLLAHCAHILSSYLVRCVDTR